MVQGGSKEGLLLCDERILYLSTAGVAGRLQDAGQTWRPSSGVQGKAASAHRMARSPHTTENVSPKWVPSAAALSSCLGGGLKTGRGGTREGAI